MFIVKDNETNPVPWSYGGFNLTQKSDVEQVINELVEIKKKCEDCIYSLSLSERGNVPDTAKNSLQADNSTVFKKISF